MGLSHWGLILNPDWDIVALSMTQDQIIAALAKSKRSEVAKATGLRPMYLYKVERGLIKNPGSQQMDVLRDYYARQPSQ
jgi:hypothetical protein